MNDTSVGRPGSGSDANLRRNAAAAQHLVGHQPALVDVALRIEAQERQRRGAAESGHGPVAFRPVAPDDGLGALVPGDLERPEYRLAARPITREVSFPSGDEVEGGGAAHRDQRNERAVPPIDSKTQAHLNLAVGVDKLGPLGPRRERTIAAARVEPT